ncbi:hypothetical protein HN51_042776 [Arachis hypogaea]|uniref:uncharacterized protein LOC107614439 isoform X1 n=1 Tax=Arachis ipaensis TaxID=130454 RepID=UPI000A2AF09B|nr:uncharacterized protein LOC107614439 isoform X1 [Arachis ipaensis]XP_020964216.1 uncharacterized protein LOC107614439 isoform X1 [Arachis ipaensis]XP_025673667.1 uncharacterized protein LOC112772874 isoform X1 [Arachis hypogaea]XP_025673668.1 uncharacterized protein LOC112772874 isoform X1 [Arachis hypogaea]XP_025673669.1 uncharacterized protein LOC112772874 isoform X1 [Arachis hypogaea]QHN94924.1 hypothetical protein DS421_18g605220 [Arachis hypogaea]
MDDTSVNEHAPHHAPPAPLVSVAPFSTTGRRLSATFQRRSRIPVPSDKPPVAWISLQGRLVNAENASSARTVGLTGEEALAWELFTPVQRFLLVAVIAVAVSESKKNKQIWNLKKSVELRDQVLSSMQQKLDDLCEQLNGTKELSTAAFNKLSNKDGELQSSEAFGAEKIKFVDCGCWHCEQHYDLFNELQGASVTRDSIGNEFIQCKNSFSNEEQEERRMSDLSDWASSVTSSAEIQLNNLVVEQDIYNLKRDCEEKDATIKDLTTLMKSSEAANYKRAAELEDIIRRKNSTISKLKKDLVVLEQKVMQLTRERRASFTAGESNGSSVLPQMRDNLIYDMDSTSSPSSSDSDSIPINNARDTPHYLPSAKNQKSAPAKVSRSRSVSPLKEVSSNRKFNAASSSSQKQLSVRGDLKKSRRRSLGGAKNASGHKRWM